MSNTSIIVISKNQIEAAEALFDMYKDPETGNYKFPGDKVIQSVFGMEQDVNGNFVLPIREIPYRTEWLTGTGRVLPAVLFPHTVSPLGTGPSVSLGPANHPSVSLEVGQPFHPTNRESGI